MRTRQLMVLIVSAIAAFPVSAFPQVKHHDWESAVGSNNASVYASTQNQDGSILMESCSINAQSCTWLMGGDTTCEKDHTYPALVNSDSYAGFESIKCEGMVSEGVYAYSFTDWKTLESLIKDSKYVGVVVPIGGTQFKVYRFSLFGMTEAQAQTEQVFSYMMNQRKSENGAQNTKNSVL